MYIIAHTPITNYRNPFVSEMSERSPSKGKVIDKDRIQKARKQIIQCESIIRKVLAIHNCYEELRNLDSESVHHCRGMMNR